MINLALCLFLFKYSTYIELVSYTHFEGVYTSDNTALMVYISMFLASILYHSVNHWPF